jgi:hypothetical protein
MLAPLYLAYPFFLTVELRHVIERQAPGSDKMR